MLLILLAQKKIICCLRYYYIIYHLAVARCNIKNTLGNQFCAQMVITKQVTAKKPEMNSDQPSKKNKKYANYELSTQKSQQKIFDKDNELPVALKRSRS